MTTLLLVRHGDTDALGKQLAGWMPGWGLNMTGRKQVTQLAQTLSPLPIRAIYTSPLERAFETAMAIAQPHGLVPVIKADLGECRFGNWEGKTFEELGNISEWQHFNRRRSLVRPPGGELMLEVQNRMVRGTEDIRSAHTEETVAIVSHADPLRALIAHYIGCPLDLLLRFSLSPASLTAVRFHDDIPNILFMNETRTGVSDL